MKFHELRVHHSFSFAYSPNRPTQESRTIWQVVETQWPDPTADQPQVIVLKKLANGEDGGLDGAIIDRRYHLCWTFDVELKGCHSCGDIEAKIETHYDPFMHKDYPMCDKCKHGLDEALHAEALSEQAAERQAHMRFHFPGDYAPPDAYEQYEEAYERWMEHLEYQAKQKTQRTLVDDNFGHYHDTDDPEVQEFYQRNQRNSVEKVCEGCGRTVRILPHYAYCNACANLREQGFDL